MSEEFKKHRRQKVIAADHSAQQPLNTYAPIDIYKDKRVPCSECGRSILWTAEQQRYWYEEIKAHQKVPINLRCEKCRDRGRHDKYKQIQRSRAKRRGIE